MQVLFAHSTAFFQYFLCIRNMAYAYCTIRQNSPSNTSERLATPVSPSKESCAGGFSRRARALSTFSSSHECTPSHELCLCVIGEFGKLSYNTKKKASRPRTTTPSALPVLALPVLLTFSKFSLTSHGGSEESLPTSH